MEGDLNQEQSTKLLVDNHHDQKGGMKTMPFIIVNEAFEKVGSYGLMPNMILYLTEVYHVQAVTGSSILYIWSSFSNGLSVFGAFVSDSYMGPFRVIATGSFSTLLGMTILWLTSIVTPLTPSACNEPNTSCSPATPTQLAILFSSFSLMSIGSGCIRPCCIAFGAEQLKQVQTGNNQRLIDSYFNWYYASVSVSAFVAITVVVYIQDQFGWRVGFAVPVFIMVCSVVGFLTGSPLYVKVKVKQSPYSGFIQALVMAFKNRRIQLRPDDCYNHSNEMDRVELTDNLRFLNKACVVRDTNIVSTVEQVESLKSVIQMVPMWSTGILLFTNVSLAYPTLQAKTMNRHVKSWFEISTGSVRPTSRQALQLDLL